MGNEKKDGSNEKHKSMSKRTDSKVKMIKTVCWALLGVRSKEGFEQDRSEIKPLPLIVAGLLGLGVLVAGLMALVHWIVGR